MWRAALDFLFPRSCLLCGVSLAPHEDRLCTRCLGSLPRTRFHAMRMNGMEQRFAGIFPFRDAAAHFFYTRDSDVARIIRSFKYSGMPGLARRMGRLMGEELYTTPFFTGLDCIVPVPVHWTRRASRGYNQAYELAVGLSETSGLQCVDALRAVHGHRSQTAMTLDGRRSNLRGSFAPRRDCDLDGRGVLLVDDVCTTGATMCEAAETLWASWRLSCMSLLALGVTV